MKHAGTVEFKNKRRAAKSDRRPRLIFLATIASEAAPGLADFAPSGQLGFETGPATSDTTLVVVHERRGKIISHIYSPVLCPRSACAAQTRKNYPHPHSSPHGVPLQPRS